MKVNEGTDGHGHGRQQANSSEPPGKAFLYIFKNKQDPTNAREILSRSDLQEKTGSGFQETDQIRVLEILSGLKFLYILYNGQVKSFYIP